MRISKYLVFVFALMVIFPIPQTTEAQQEYLGSMEILRDIERTMMGEHYSEMQWLMSQFAQGALPREDAERLKELAELHPEAFVLVLHRLDMTAMFELLQNILREIDAGVI